MRGHEPKQVDDAVIRAGEEIGWLGGDTSDCRIADKSRDRGASRQIPDDHAPVLRAGEGATVGQHRQRFDPARVAFQRAAFAAVKISRRVPSLRQEVICPMSVLWRISMLEVFGKRCEICTDGGEA